MSGRAVTTGLQRIIRTGTEWEVTATALISVGAMNLMADSGKKDSTALRIEATTGNKASGRAVILTTTMALIIISTDEMKTMAIWPAR